MKARTIASNEFCDYLYREGRPGSIMNTIRIEKIENILMLYDKWYECIMNNATDPFYLSLYQEMMKRFWTFYNKYPPCLTKEDFETFCAIMDQRKVYANNRPKAVKMDKCIFVISYFKSRTICNLFRLRKKFKSA